MSETTVHRVAQYQVATLAEPITLDNGDVLAAGSTVVFCPATIAEVVRLQGVTLAEAWLTMQYNFAELTRQSADTLRRNHALEVWAIKNGYVPPSEEATSE